MAHGLGWIRSDNTPITIGADCAGIGSGIQGIAEVCTEHQTAFMSEINDDTRHICQHYAQPQACQSNVMSRKRGNAKTTDVYIAGFPCQPYSSLGLRTGMNDAKGRAEVVHKVLEHIQIRPTHDILARKRQRTKER